MLIYDSYQLNNSLLDKKFKQERDKFENKVSIGIQRPNSAREVNWTYMRVEFKKIADTENIAFKLHLSQRWGRMV